MLTSAYLIAENEQVILMESAAKVRRMILRDGHSIRSVNRSTCLSRNTIKKYLKDASPPRCDRKARPIRHKLQGFEDRLRSLFEHDRKRARRERRTAVKLYEQLVTEGYTGSYSPVCRFVKALKADGSKYWNHLSHFQQCENNFTRLPRRCHHLGDSQTGK